MEIAFRVFTVLCLINLSIVSSLHTTKSCAEYKITPRKYFKKELYLGDWFVHQMYDEPSTPNEYPGSSQYNCLAIIRTPRPDGSQNYQLILVDPGVLPKFISEAVTTFTHPGEGRYRFSSEDLSTYNGEYIILATDYVTYSIECKCTDLSEGGSEVEFYVLSRGAVVPFFTQKQIDKVINDHHFETDKIRTLNILSCPAELRGSDGLLAGLLKLVKKLVGGVLGILG